MHRPALSDPHVLRGGGLHENWGHPKFLGGMAEKQPGCSQGDPAGAAGAAGGEERPGASPGGEHPRLHPRCEQTDIISPPDARGELGMLGGSRRGPGQLGTAPSCAF